jgi:alginate export protein
LKAEDRPPHSTEGPSTQPSPALDWTTGLKQHLPDWLGFSGQYRGRFEGQTGRNFVSGDNDFYYLSQLRLDLKIRLSSRLRLMLEEQDSRSPGLELRPRPANFQDSFDVRQAYLELHSGDLKTAGVQLGRQEMSFGEERLIGYGNWGNTSRSFDAARFYVSTPSTRLDVLAATLVRTRDGSFDSPQLRGNNESSRWQRI